MRYYWLFVVLALIAVQVIARTYPATDGRCVQMLEGECIKISRVK
jgi:hypothetical protein